jgi:radical SAM protein with 4Fe4S-binding SPASM domain
MKVSDIASRLTAAIMDGLWRSFPPVVRLETTNRCNAVCAFCPRLTMRRPTGIMEQGLFERLAREAAEGGCRSLHLHNFGEPLLDPDLPERVALAKGLGIKRVKIFSNGSLLFGERAERLLGSGLDEIKISIDGADAEEFARLRKGLSLETIVDNARAFVKERDRAMPGRGPSVVAACTQTSDREATSRMLAGVVDAVDYGRLHNWGGVMTSLGKRRLRKPCARLWQTFTVLWNGDVSLCCLDYEGAEILGQVREQTIREVWQDESYREVRDLHRLSRQEQIPLCRECSKSFY